MRDCFDSERSAVTRVCLLNDDTQMFCNTKKVSEMCLIIYALMIVVTVI